MGDGHKIIHAGMEPILDLAKKDPLVRNAVMLWEKGETDWEGMLAFLVCVLSDNVRSLQRTVTKMKQGELPSLTLLVSPEFIDAKRDE